AFNKLRNRGGVAPKPRSKPKASVSAPEVDFKLSINIIGMRVEEAIKNVTPFIDNAHVNGAARVEIIHGTGTGALKQAVREFLKDSPSVKSFTDAELTAGGAGVTIAEFR
ncbi:MAG: Smr/MutS family protein, partial [Proteobacteria bacterium]|nr:Smr/MutS family protein [Pseudomonadota bacterium]